MKDFFNPLYIKRYWKGMDQSLFTIKTLKTLAIEMFKIKL